MHAARDSSPPAEPGTRAAARFWAALVLFVLGCELGGHLLLPPWPYYRGWNVAHRDSGPFAPTDVPGPFFPHVRYVGSGYGDLAFLTDVPALRQPRAETFTTDGLGFRNPTGHEQGPWHAIAFGDSMMAGAGLGDGERFSARLSELSGATVYDASGKDASLVMADARWIRTPPRFFVLESVERFLLADDATERLARLAPGSTESAPAVGEQPAAAVRGRWSRAYSAATHYGALVHGSVRYLLFGELFGQDCVLGTDGRTLFSAEELVHAALPPAVLGIERIADALAAARDALAAHGIELVYFVSPDKATLERELVPAPFLASMRPTGEAIEALHDALEARSIAHVDVLSAFREAQRAEPGRALFWTDDTHWTPHGADVAARAAALVLERMAADR